MQELEKIKRMTAVYRVGTVKGSEHDTEEEVDRGSFRGDGE